MDWLQIINYGVAILGIAVGAIFYLKWDEAVKAMQELGEAFTKTADILADKDVTKQELKECLKEWMDVYMAIMSLIGKKL